METHQENTGAKRTDESDIEAAGVSTFGISQKVRILDWGLTDLPILSARIPETIRPKNDPAFSIARRLFDIYKLIPWAIPYDGR